ncbi:MAG: helix-turn-helix transcriptional regulator, partial [Verrucomicrobia bacterium]|nr:helix-turn-helix transcriptional regulator [Verrucomicrobiota bacterium]
MPPFCRAPPTTPTRTPTWPSLSETRRGRSRSKTVVSLSDACGFETAVIFRKAHLTDKGTLRKVCHMTPPQPLRPTLWRTCRVIANPTRLKIFALLAEQPGQTVSGVADRLKLPLSEASESLRALEARGLLTARREGR